MSRSARLLGFAVAAALCVTVLASPSKADQIVTFTVSATMTTGSLNGITTFDETTNTMTAVNINAPATGAGPFTITGGFAANGGGGTVVGVQDGLGDFLFLNFVTPTPGSVAGYLGGPLGSTTNIFNSSTGSFNFIQSGSLTPTPEPSSLLLLSTAASGLGLLRKKITKA